MLWQLLLERTCNTCNMMSSVRFGELLLLLSTLSLVEWQNCFRVYLCPHSGSATRLCSSNRSTCIFPSGYLCVQSSWIPHIHSYSPQLTHDLVDWLGNISYFAFRPFISAFHDHCCCLLLNTKIRQCGHFYHFTMGCSFYWIELTQVKYKTKDWKVWLSVFCLVFDFIFIGSEASSHWRCAYHNL